MLSKKEENQPNSQIDYFTFEKVKTLSIWM